MAFEQGFEFSSFEEFKTALKEFEQATFATFCIKNSQTVEKANSRRRHKVPEQFVVARAHYVCSHFGTSRRTGGEVRQRKTTTTKLGCEAGFVLSYNDRKNCLFILKLNSTHNHPTSIDTFMMERKNKALNKNKRKKNAFRVPLGEKESESVMELADVKLGNVELGNVVLILTCGGTIDKQYPQGPGAYAFEFGEAAVGKVLSRLCPSFPYQIESICAKDGQEMLDGDREDILRAVMDGSQQLVLITHGTDTLCDTARYLVNAGVGQGLQYGPGVGGKTVVLTGSFKPEAMKDSDAEFNVGFALGFLLALTPGVFIAIEGGILDGKYVMRREDGKFLDERFALKQF